MKWLSVLGSFALMVTLTVGSSGCKKGEKGTAESGGTEKYTVTGPADTSIKPGEEAKVTVKIDRKGDFKDDVTVDVTNLPDKVTATPKETKVGKDNNSATITLKAADDAPAVDNHVVKIKTSGGGASKEVDFKLTVKKKG